VREHLAVERSQRERRRGQAIRLVHHEVSELLCKQTVPAVLLRADHAADLGVRAPGRERAFDVHGRVTRHEHDRAAIADARAQQRRELAKIALRHRSRLEVQPHLALAAQVDGADTGTL
jgi:hypothetical protein